MEYKVLKTFKDKNTRKLCAAGDIIDITADRAAEINKTIPDAVEKKTKRKKKTEEEAAE